MLVGTKTKRPIPLHMKYDPDCQVPLCQLVSDADPNLADETPLQEIHAYIEAENKRLEHEFCQLILTISGLKVQCYLILEDIGPELSRTVIVSTKLDTKIPQFACPSDVEDFLSPPASTLDGTILGESPFSQQCFLKELVLEKIQLPVILVSSLAETFLSKLVKLVLKDEDIPQLEGSESSVQVPGYSITTPWTSL
ncbi:Dynamin-like protein ARC5 [Quillaja saponaria]|uniref:Dynamin-like protein ARC5 n=1 Tax=Quillaja saponaria TaxID=32244 RepID=A0AAD7M3S6_QUISA|nr:Dynamin-like protein ARC5 [Quillaja saponaria]